MIDIFQEFQTNTDAESAGVWVSYAGETEFLIARWQNKNFKRLFARLYEKHKGLIKTKPGDTDARMDVAEMKEDEVLVECLAKTILLGWKGVAAKGVALEYSYENAVAALKVKDFRDWVQSQALDVSLFKHAEEESEVKK